jgi:ankyrin repeat protein
MDVWDPAGDLAAAFLAAASEGDLSSMQGLMGASDMAIVCMTATDEDGMSGLMHAAKSGHLDAMRLLLDHPSADPAAMITHTTEDGITALLWACSEGEVDAMRLLLDHPAADPAAMLMHTNRWGTSALMEASHGHRLDVMRLLLDHPSANPAEMMMLTTEIGVTVLMWAAHEGEVDAMRLLLDHPSANPAEMMMQTGGSNGITTLMAAAQHGYVNAMRLLLDHPSANPAAMILHAGDDGYTALLLAARNGHMESMRLLLDHPSADPAAMMASRSTSGTSALTAAARFAAGRSTYCSCSRAPARSCAALLLLLRRVAMEPQPSDAQKAHMNEVVEVLCHTQGPRSQEMFDNDTPDGARDECVALLLELGADSFNLRRPVIARIIRECFALARVPQLVNEAIVGMAMVRQQQKPRDNA